MINGTDSIILHFITALCYVQCIINKDWCDSSRYNNLPEDVNGFYTSMFSTSDIIDVITIGKTHIEVYHGHSVEGKCCII